MGAVAVERFRAGRTGGQSECGAGARGGGESLCGGERLARGQADRGQEIRLPSGRRVTLLGPLFLNALQKYTL